MVDVLSARRADGQQHDQRQTSGRSALPHTELRNSLKSSGAVLPSKGMEYAATRCPR